MPIVRFEDKIGKIHFILCLSIDNTNFVIQSLQRREKNSAENNVTQVLNKCLRIFERHVPCIKVLILAILKLGMD